MVESIRGYSLSSSCCEKSSKSDGPRELAVFQPHEDGRSLVGRVVGKGLTDELYEKGYLILLATLHDRELAATARDIAAVTGLHHHPTFEGERVSDIYRRSLALASGGFAMLDDGLGFRLVPWKPVIEQRLGQPIAAVIRNGRVSWELGRQRGPSIG